MSSTFAPGSQNVVLTERMLPELFHRIATFLSHHDRIVAAHVSRSWRATLLQAPLLWSNISLCPRTRGNLEHVADALQELLGRSQGIPLTVELSLKADQSKGSVVDVSYFDDPNGAFKHAIPSLLIPHMARIKSLSLQIHEWSGTVWEDLFKMPAPVLERFRLAITCGEDDEPLPDNLFNNFAPKLRNVQLDYVVMPENPAPALAGITSFFYDQAHCVDESNLRQITSWRNLQDLTIGADDFIGLPPGEVLRGARLRRLQLWNFCDTDTILRAFPDAQHVCFSAGLVTTDRLVNSANIRHLLTACQGNGNVQVVEIGYREQLFPALNVDDKADLAWSGGAMLFAVRLDGRDVVVDLPFANLGHILLVDSLIRRLRYLAIPQELFPLFDVDRLPALEALTLYVGPLPANVPRPAPVMGQRAHRVSILHMVRVLAKAEDHLPPSPIQVRGIINFIQSKLAVDALRRIVLEGFTLATAEEYQLLRGIVPDVSFIRGGSGWLEDDDCGPWKWWFPTEHALRV